MKSFLNSILGLAVAALSLHTATLAAVAPAATTPSGASTKQGRTPAVSPSKPNILLLFADDQRADTIGAHGNPHIKTPVIDGLARTGVSFRRNYVMGGNSGAGTSWPAPPTGGSAGLGSARPLLLPDDGAWGGDRGGYRGGDRGGDRGGGGGR